MGHEHTTRQAPGSAPAAPGAPQSPASCGRAPGCPRSAPWAPSGSAVPMKCQPARWRGPGVVDALVTRPLRWPGRPYGERRCGRRIPDTGAGRQVPTLACGGDMARIIRELAPLAVVAVVVGAVTLWLLETNPGVGRWVLAAILFGHGWVHLMFLFPRPAPSDDRKPATGKPADGLALRPPGVLDRDADRVRARGVRGRGSAARRGDVRAVRPGRARHGRDPGSGGMVAGARGGVHRSRRWRCWWCGSPRRCCSAS